MQKKKIREVGVRERKPHLSLWEVSNLKLRCQEAAAYAYLEKTDKCQRKQLHKLRMVCLFGRNQKIRRGEARNYFYS